MIHTMPCTVSVWRKWSGDHYECLSRAALIIWWWLRTDESEAGSISHVLREHFQSHLSSSICLTLQKFDCSISEIFLFYPPSSSVAENLKETRKCICDTKKHDMSPFHAKLCLLIYMTCYFDLWPPKYIQTNPVPHHSIAHLGTSTNFHTVSWIGIACYIWVNIQGEHKEVMYLNM